MSVKITVEYFDDCGDLFVPLFTDGGILREEDGSIKLYYKPF